MFYSRIHRYFGKRSESLRNRDGLARRRCAIAVRAAIEGLEDRTMMSFTAPVAYPGAASPVAMVSGDFNNDGHIDVVTTNSVTNTVTALLGNGDGTFQRPQSSPLGAAPGSVFTGSQASTLATGDFNGDGKRDVVTVSGTNAIILLGNGDGTFQAPISVFLGNSPTRISTADLNNDGKIDVVAANTSGTVSVLIGHGDGTFAPATTYAAGPSPQDVKAIDLNHDGTPDLVVANGVSAGSISVMMGNGDGTFQPYHSFAAFSAPYQITVGDFNDDGNMDVAVSNSYTSSCVSVLLSNGDGTFQPYHSYDTGAQPWELQAADVNGDGKLDLVDTNGGSFQVELNNGDGTFGLPTTTFGTGLAFSAADFNGDGAADLVGANGGSINSMLNTGPVVTNASTAVGFALSSPATTSAGAALPLTVTAIDANGNTVPDFLGAIHLTTTDAQSSGTTYYFGAADAGTHTFNNLSLYTTGAQTITANGPPLLTGSETVNVMSAAASKMSISADASTVAGGSVSFTVTTEDAYGNFAPNYTGTMRFSSGDVQAGLPANYTFTVADAGIHTFIAVLKTAGAPTISATDTNVATITGTSNSVLVTPATASSLGLVGGGGQIGAPHIVTVTAYDSFGNVATGYNGTTHLAASNASTVLSADSALVNGVGSFSVTPMTLGAQTLTVIDTGNGSLIATETITGTPGAATRLAISPVTGGAAGSAQTATVTAYDNFGNVAVDYAGSVLFTSTDTQASLPFYTFTAADKGTHTFTISMKTAGTQSLTVRDYFSTLISATQTGIVITPLAAATIAVGTLQGSVAGVAQSLVVTARDIYGNIATSYRGTLNFSSSDTLATMLPTYTFTAADAGTHTFSITLKTAGDQTFTVHDAATPSMSSVQLDIPVSAAAMVGFAFRAATNGTTGVAFAVTLSAVDAFGNTITGYVGKVHFTGPSGNGNLLPPDYIFTAADNGTHIFSVALSSTGTMTLNVTDTVNSALKGNMSIVMKSATGNGGGGGGGTVTPTQTPAPTPTPTPTPAPTPAPTPTPTPTPAPPKGGGGTGGGKKVP